MRTPFAQFLLVAFHVLISSAMEATAAPFFLVDGSQVTSSPVVREARATIAISGGYPNGVIYYTLDGSEPTAASLRYTSAFAITSTKTIRALAYSLDFSESSYAGPLVVEITPPVPLVTLGLFGGGGSISVNPPPTDGKYRSNTVVRLTAIPNSGWTFMNWLVPPSGTANPIDLLLDGNKIAFAVFGTHVNALPPTRGRIASNYDLSQLIAANANVSVTAVPDNGFYLAAWGGMLAGSGSMPSSGFTLVTPNPTISALFQSLPENKVTLTAYSDSIGGRVTFENPSNMYDRGSSRTLTATPIQGWSFVGWSGDIEGLANPITVTLDSSMMMLGHFAPGLRLDVQATGGGTVIRTPDLELYPTNSTVTLEAIPNPGFTFANWDNGVTVNPRTVALSTVSFPILARFDAPAKTPAWSFSVSSPLHSQSHGRATEIAADADDNVFIISTEHAAKLSNSGSVAWNFYLHPGGVPSDGAINQDVAVGSAGLGFVANSGFSMDNPTVARISVVNNGAIVSEINSGMLDKISLASDGTIYAPSRVRPVQRYPLNWPSSWWLEAFEPDGSTRWRFAEPGPPEGTNNYSRPAVATDGRIYFYGVGSSNVVNCLSPVGVLQWKYHTGIGDQSLNYSPILGNDSVYLIDAYGRLVALTRNGQLKWRFQGAEPLQTPSIGADGVLYLGARGFWSTSVYAVNPDGSLRWKKSPGQSPYGVPAIGSDGTIYITDRDSLHAMDANGDRLWMFLNPRSSLGGNILADPIIAGSKVITADREAVFAFEAPARGPANSSWPMVDGSKFGNSQEQPVIPAPQIDLATLQVEAGEIQMRIEAQPGATIIVHHSIDLKTWSVLRTETTQSGEIVFQHAGDPTTPHFYKFVQE